MQLAPQSYPETDCGAATYRRMRAGRASLGPVTSYRPRPRR
jgi:hypothetical protein